MQLLDWDSLDLGRRLHKHFPLAVLIPRRVHIAE